MAINFPDSPTLNQVFSSEGKTWKWSGVRWEILVVDQAELSEYYYSSQEVDEIVDGIKTVLSDTQPASPTEGLRWLKTTTFQEFMYYNGTWIEV